MLAETLIRPAGWLVFVQRWWARVDHPALRFVTVVFVISRVLLVMISVVATTLLWAHATNNIAPPVAGEIWRRWDVHYYVTIAEHGYAPEFGVTLPAFFPLYPLLIKLTAFLTLGNTYIAALLVSNGAFFVACYQLYRLAERDFSVTVARGAVLAMASFPAAIFCFIPYPEALFLALAISALRAMREHRWLVAALLGLLAALTRQSGALLVLPFAWEYLSDLHRQRQQDENFLPRLHLRAGRAWLVALRPLALVLLIPAGTALYALWLWHVVGDPLAFVHAQAAWGRHTVFPLLPIWQGTQYALTGITPMLINRTWLDLASVLLMVVLTVVGWRLMPKSYLWYVVPLFLLFLSQPKHVWVLSSQSRFMLELFPLFIVLGAVVVQRKAAQVIALVLAGSIQLVVMALFARGGWVA